MNHDDANAEQTYKKIRELNQKVAEQAAVIEKLIPAIRFDSLNTHLVEWRDVCKVAEVARTDSKQILADWMREQLGEPVAQINVNARKLEFTMPTVIDTPTIVNLPPIPLFKLPECLR